MASANEELEQAQQAQDALRESEERYRAVVQQVSEAIFLLDPQTKHLLEANAAFLNLLGYSTSEIPHLTIYDLLPYDPSSIDAAAHQALLDGEYHLVDQQYRRKDGSLVMVQVSITAITYSGKRVLCEVLRDISERKQMEDVLARRVRQQAGVANLGQRALSGIDLDTLMDEAATIVTQTLGVEFCKILELMPDGTQLLLRAGCGWTEGLVGNMMLDAGLDSHSGYTLVAAGPVIVEDLRTEKRFNAPPLLRDHDVISGVSVIIHGRSRPFGVIGAHTSSHRNFTQDDIYFLQAVANVLAQTIERNLILQELKASRDQLGVILQGVADGITVQDPTGRLIYANDAALRLVGYSSQDELLAAPLAQVLNRFELIDERGQPLDPSDFPGRHALQGRGTSEIVVGWRTRATGETRWSVVKAAPVRNVHGQVQLAVSIFRDITDQVERERRKDDFIALASHELKTPITSLKIFTQLLRRRFERVASQSDPEQGETTPGPGFAHARELATDALVHLVRMDGQVDKLSELVRDLLDTSKITSGKISYTFERFDIGQLVQETVADLQRITDKHSIQIEKQARQEVVADRERIRQVLTNLLTNAIKYSPTADRILVRVEQRDPKEVLVCVQDFGIGVPDDQHDKIFNRFFQVSNPEQRLTERDTFPGLGLGLYISSEIIKRHGGRIWVESEVGKGSTFCFTLPIDAQTLSSAEDIRADGEQTHPGG